MKTSDLIESCVTYIKEHYPTRTKYYDKCYRDLNDICDSIEKDLEFQTTDFTKRIANHFWLDGERRLKTYEVEVEVYQLMRQHYASFKTADEMVYINSSLDKLIDIVTNGIDDSAKWHDLVEASKTAQHCQRNWDDSVPPPQDVDALVKIGTNMPTKQNVPYYKLIVSTNRVFNKFVWDYSINPDEVDKTRYRNAQVDANILFLYFSNTDFMTKHYNVNYENYNHGKILNIGISSGAVALAANQMGYKTGFCGCFMKPEIKKELVDNYNIELAKDEEVELLLGIGKPKIGYKWHWAVDNDGEVIFDAKSIPKNITVHNIS